MASCCYADNFHALVFRPERLQLGRDMMGRTVARCICVIEAALYIKTAALMAAVFNVAEFVCQVLFFLRRATAAPARPMPSNANVPGSGTVVAFTLNAATTKLLKPLPAVPSSPV